jgi:hypothetical protein
VLGAPSATGSQNNVRYAYLGFGNLPNDYAKLRIIVPLLVTPQELESYCEIVAALKVR